MFFIHNSLIRLYKGIIYNLSTISDRQILLTSKMLNFVVEVVVVLLIVAKETGSYTIYKGGRAIYSRKPILSVSHHSGLAITKVQLKGDDEDDSPKLEFISSNDKPSISVVSNEELKQKSTRLTNPSQKYSTESKFGKSSKETAKKSSVFGSLSISVCTPIYFYPIVGDKI